jgi:hypothetical protein
MLSDPTNRSALLSRNEFIVRFLTIVVMLSIFLSAHALLKWWVLSQA